MVSVRVRDARSVAQYECNGRQDRRSTLYQPSLVFVEASTLRCRLQMMQVIDMIVLAGMVVVVLGGGGG